jgi:hypothetical protein
MPRATIAASVLVVLLGAQAAKAQEAVELPTLYHPTKLGDKWVEVISGKDRIFGITAVEVKNGATVVTVSEFIDDKPRNMIEVVSVSESGIAEHEHPGTKYDPPVWVLKVEQPGVSWNEGKSIPENGQLLGKRTVRAPEEVTVPAGKFLAIPVVFEDTYRGQNRKVIRWFAPTVGEVRLTVDDKVVRELKSFTPAK